ncbi:MAG: radical SAM protein [Planctomycetota bacterium]|nr:MAG: radical SAM protein [Planctomycetota bacterium]
MLTLINTNRMVPVIGPIGLDYIAGSVSQSGIDAELIDLAFAEEPSEAIRGYFSNQQPELVGLSFRNADDCFWPSADWFVGGLKETIETIRSVTEAPVVVGGVGFSIFAKEIVEYTGADFGIRGDGETAIVELIQQLREGRKFSEVPGLIWREDGRIRSNPAAWPSPIRLGTGRDFVDNLSYFKKGGQCGLETKRGCNRRCIYCADPLAKGSELRLREPSEVADEIQSLLSQGIDVLHFCDSEFNIPRSHAAAICDELKRCGLGKRIRWYAYMSVTPFDEELASKMAQAGCAGVDFTGDSGSPAMLQTYRQQHNKDDLACAVRICQANDIVVMIDLLLGGPGETPQTVQETIDFIKKINPECAGAALGVRIYPGTGMGEIAAQELRKGKDSNIRRKYEGAIDLLKPTFYISDALGERPTELVRDLIGGDERFFEPAVEVEGETTEEVDGSNYNYNENLPLIKAIENGARGAYWDILRQLRKGQ